MKLNKLQASLEITDEVFFSLSEEQVDKLVVHELSHQLAGEIARTYPTSVTRIAVPSPVGGDPDRFMLPAKYYRVDQRYTMGFFVFTEQELQAFVEETRKQLMLELAADRALLLLPESKNRA